MAQIRWYLNATTLDGWSLVDQTAATAATLTAGWVVGTGLTNSSEHQSGASTDRASTTFVGNTVPDGTLDLTLKDAFRSQNSQIGTFAAGNWTFQFAVVSTVQAGAADGQIVFRILKANADGTNATEITSGQQATTIATNVGATDVNISATISLPSWTITNQYLFIQVAWKRTGAGGMTTTNIRLRTGSSATVGTTGLTADFTPGDQAVTGVHHASTFVSHPPTVDAVAPVVDQDVDSVAISSTAQVRVPTVAPGAVAVGSGTRPTTVQMFVAALTVGAVAITGATVAATSVRYTPTVATGAVAVGGSTRASTAQTFVPTVEVGGIPPQTISATTLPSTAIVRTPSVSAGPALALGATITATTVVRTPTVVAGGIPPTDLWPFTIAASSVVYTPGVTGGAITVWYHLLLEDGNDVLQEDGSSFLRLEPATISGDFIAVITIDSGLQVFSPHVQPADEYVDVPAIAKTGNVYAPFVLAVTEIYAEYIASESRAFRVWFVSPEIGAPTIINSSGTFEPSLTTLTPITAATIPAGSVVRLPSLAVGPVSVLAATIAAVGQVFGPQVRVQGIELAGPTRPSTSQTFAPVVAAGAVTIGAPTILSTSATFAPKLSVQTIGATIPSGSGLFPPSLVARVVAATRPSTSQVFSPSVVLIPLQFVTTAQRIASGLVLFPPSLATGAVTITAGHRGSTAIIRAPSVAPGTVTISGPTTVVPSYASAVLADGAVVYWRHDAKTGQTVFDHTGHGHHGTYPAGVTLGVPGALADGNTAVGRSTYGEANRVPYDAILGGVLGTEFTLECWVRTTNLGTTYWHPFRKEGGYSGHGDVSIYVTSTADGVGNENFLFIYGTTAAVVWVHLASHPTKLTLNIWHHVAVTYGAAGAVIYIDGIPGPTYGYQGPLATDATWTTQILEAGTAIDDSAIYGRVLSVAEIQNHYGLRLAVPPALPALFPPKVAFAFVGASIPTSADLFPPTLAYAVTTAFRSPTSIARPPTIIEPHSVDLKPLHIGSTCRFFGPTVTGISEVVGAHIPQFDPAAYWPLDDPAGSTTVRDLAGSRTSTFRGSVTPGVPGIAGSRAVQFGGFGSGIILDTRSLPNIYPAFTIEAWGKHTQGAAAGRMPVLARVMHFHGDWHAVHAPNYGQDYLTIINESYRTASAYAPMLLDTWQHIVWTGDGVTCTIYRDGVAIGTAPLLTKVTIDGAGVGPTHSIGCFGEIVDAESWVGSLQDVAFYQRILSPAEIAEHYALRPQQSSAAYQAKILGKGVFPPAVALVVSGAHIAPVTTPFAPAVSVSAVGIEAGHIVSGGQVFAPRVQPGAFPIVAPTIGSTAVTYPPRVGVTIYAATMVPASQAFGPSLAVGPAFVQTAPLASTATVRAPIIGLPALGYVTTAHLSSTVLLRRPAIGTGAIGISTGTIGSTGQANAPTLGPSIQVPHIGSTATLTGPTLEFGVTTGHIGSTAITRPPTVLAPLPWLIHGNTIGSSALVHRPALAPQAVTVVGGTCAPTSQVFAPVVLPALFGPTIGAGSGTFPPTVIGVAFISTGTIPATSYLRAPRVELAAIQTIGLVRIGSTATLFGVTVTPDAVTVGSGTITNVSTLHAPRLATLLVGGTITNVSALHAPSLGLGVVTAPRLASTAQVYAPSLVPVWSVTAAHVRSTVRIFAPTLAVGAVAVAPPLIASGSNLFAPALGLTVRGATISSTAQVFALTVAPGPATIDAATITASTTLFPISLSIGITTAPITSTADLYAPSQVVVGQEPPAAFPITVYFLSASSSVVFASASGSVMMSAASPTVMMSSVSVPQVEIVSASASVAMASVSVPAVVMSSKSWGVEMSSMSKPSVALSSRAASVEMSSVSQPSAILSSSSPTIAMSAREPLHDSKIEVDDHVDVLT